MKPHMRHIADWAYKKKAAEEAKDIPPLVDKYQTKVNKAKTYGYTNQEIIDELENEKETIRNSEYKGDDALMMKGVENTKASCMAAIDIVISGLK